MNIKRQQSEYEFLFSKQNEKGKLLNNTEIAQILGVSKSSVGNARKKYKNPMHSEEIVKENENKLSGITLSHESLDYLLLKVIENESKASSSRNLLENYYNELCISLCDSLETKNKLKLKELTRKTTALKLELQNTKNLLENERKVKELENLTLELTNYEIALKQETLSILKNFLMQNKRTEK